MHEILVFNSSNGQAQDVEKVMSRLALRMSAFQRSIEYVQDYIDLPGLKVWQEELSRVVYYNIEQECNRFLKKKVYDHQSKYQSRAIPIPRFPPLDAENVTFMGRVLGAVLRMTDPKTTIYAPEGPGWFHVSTYIHMPTYDVYLTLNVLVNRHPFSPLHRRTALKYVASAPFLFSIVQLESLVLVVWIVS